jgi:methylglutaconyl-CoA hydratase
MSKGSVNLNISNDIGTITFYHPSSNAMPGYLLEDLKNTIQEADVSKDVNVIVLQSEGRTFCAGASFDELIALNNFEEAVQFFMGFAKVINAMRATNKFIIAKVQGKSVGGGVGLIAAADYALATEKAAIKLSELSIGIGPYVIGPAVKRKIGVAAFSELSINATSWHTAFWAREKGLFAKVFESQSALEEESLLLAQKLATYDPNATKLLKRELWEGTEHWPELLAQKAEISAQLVLQDFTKSVLNKFKEK